MRQRSTQKYELKGCEACENSVDGEHYGFKYFDLKQGESISRTSLSLNLLVLSYSGDIKVTYDNCCSVILEPLEMVLIPRDASVCLEMLTSSKLLLLKFDTYTSVCKKFRDKDYLDYLDDGDYLLYKLPIYPSLEKLLSLFLQVLKLGVDCMNLHEMKRREFFFFLKHYYKDEQIARLFYPILSSRFSFRDFIYKHCTDHSTVNDLIEVSGMSRSTFYDKFKEVFGVTAKQWLLKRRAQKVYERLTTPDAIIKEVMYDCDFNSPSQFNRFCRHYLGDTPTNIIRKAK